MSPRILDLPNLGPTSEAPPETAGTTTIDHRRLGAVRASVEVDAAGCRSSLDVLWALEGALAGPCWRDGAREHRAGRLRALTYIRRDLEILSDGRGSMAYDEQLVQRLREALAAKPGMTERRMFGGIAFMSAGRMIVGVLGSALVARVGKAEYEASLRRPHVRKMDFTGRPMQGYVYVDSPGIRTERQLRVWLQRCESFVETLPPK